MVETVTLKSAVPGEVSVTEGLLEDAVIPDVVGEEVVRLTFPANPFRLVTVTVEKFDDPAMMLMMNGFGERP